MAGRGGADLSERTEYVRSLALDAGFSRARLLAQKEAPEEAFAAFLPADIAGTTAAILVVALPYGNDDPDARMATPAEHAEKAAVPAFIAAFARRNYYAEAVARLKHVAAELRLRYGGSKAGYRIFCNSRVPEKPLALAAGIGSAGRNTLVITPEAGSLVVLAILTIPFPVRADAPLRQPVCGSCTLCVAACPTGALDPEGRIDRARCIQWYASGNGDPPVEVADRWGQRLYGCSDCQDLCPHNRKAIPGIATDRGALPPSMDARELAAASDEEIRSRFRGSAMGMAWLGPVVLRKNAERVLAASSGPTEGSPDRPFRCP